MRRKLLGATFLAVAALMVGCGDYDEIIVVCYDNQDTWCEEVGAWQDRDLVCNMAVTVQDECERLVGMIPDWLPEWVLEWITIPDVCNHIPEKGYLGTCQDGSEGLDCAESEDCLGECEIAVPDEEGTCGADPSST
jgi:hypothetical protein